MYDDTGRKKRRRKNENRRIESSIIPSRSRFEWPRFRDNDERMKDKRRGEEGRNKAAEEKRTK